jgi:hypothetical protein
MDRAFLKNVLNAMTSVFGFKKFVGEKYCKKLMDLSASNALISKKKYIVRGCYL